MHFENSFLYGIQKIPGDTASEKFKFINVTAKEVANNIHVSECFPESLKPLLNVEVAKILNKTESIVQALLTSDALLCHRALKIPDLFLNEDSPLLNWDYFNNVLLSQISLKTRCKLIKKISQDLQKKDPKYADTFYLEISKKYGLHEALPLLLACSVNFLNDQIINNHIVISERYVCKLFLKYPDFIISYITKCIVHDVNKKEDYKKFLSNLLEGHFDALIKICDSRDCNIYLTFSKRKTKTFLKKGTKILIEKPQKYLHMLSFEIVSKKLSMDEFTTMLSNLLPTKLEDFEYDDRVSTLLRYFSKETKVVVIVTAFNKSYGKNLYDYPNLITPNLLIILPTEDRIKIARMKLEEDDDLHIYCKQTSWRAYLPFMEIFDFIKTRIAKQSDVNERKALIILLIYNCKINQDKEGLLNVLEYVLTRHKNEKSKIINSILCNVRNYHNLIKLYQSHWDIIMEIVKRLIANDKYCYRENAIRILIDGIQFKFENNLCPDDYIRYFLTVNDNSSNIRIICSNTNLDLEKVSLKKFLDLIDISYIEDKLNDEYAAIRVLLSCIESYNDKVKCENENQKSEIPFINIEDHPKFIKFIESTVLPSCSKLFGLETRIQTYFLKYNIELFEKWFELEKPAHEKEEDEEEEEDSLILISQDDIRKLKKNYLTILDKWEIYHLSSACFINNTITKIFIKSLRWYKDLPIKFVSTSIMDLKDPDELEAMQILGLLLDGKTYQELIDPIIPLKPILNVNDEESMKMKKEIEACVMGMKLTNPPISLTLMERLFSNDFFPICRKRLSSMARRIPTPTVINFASRLIDERVAVSKQMIELLCMVASKEVKYKVFQTIIKSKRHPSIHIIIIKKVWKSFKQAPDESIWNLMQTCLECVIEDRQLLEQLASLQFVSNEYLAPYTEKLLTVFEKINLKGYPDLPTKLVTLVLRQLNSNFAKQLPNEFQNKLIEKYMFDSAFNEKKPSLNVDFLFEVFLNHDNIEERLTFLSERLKNFVDEHFDEPLKNDKGRITYPANKLIRDIVSFFVSSLEDKEVNMVIVNSLQSLFNSVITPWQDVQSFLYLAWIKEFDKFLKQHEFGQLFGEKMDVWINIFGSAYFMKICQFIEKFIDLIYYPNRDKLKFVDGLLEAKNSNAYICAAVLLTNLRTKNDTHYNYIIEKLKSKNVPTVRALLHERIYFS